mgnify:CR=1 FL=1
MGDVYLGACSSAQKNMENTADPCYVSANEVKLEIVPILDNFDFGTFLNKISVIQIKISATEDACNFKLLYAKIDSRLSDLDFTTGMISNVIAQFFAGLASQSFENGTNSASPTARPIYVTFNEIWCAYSFGQYIDIGRYFFMFWLTLVGFNAPSVDTNIGSF